MKWAEVKKAIREAKIPNSAIVESIKIYPGIIKKGYIFIEYNDPKTGYSNLTIDL